MRSAATTARRTQNRVLSDKFFNGLVPPNTTSPDVLFARTMGIPFIMPSVLRFNVLHMYRRMLNGYSNTVWSPQLPTQFSNMVIEPKFRFHHQLCSFLAI